MKDNNKKENNNRNYEYCPDCGAKLYITQRVA